MMRAATSRVKSSNRAELSMASAGADSSRLSLTAAAMLAVNAAAPDASGTCNFDADRPLLATPATASSGPTGDAGGWAWWTQAQQAMYCQHVEKKQAAQLWVLATLSQQQEEYTTGVTNM